MSLVFTHQAAYPDLALTDPATWFALPLDERLRLCAQIEAYLYAEAAREDLPGVVIAAEEYRQVNLQYVADERAAEPVWKH